VIIYFIFFIVFDYDCMWMNELITHYNNVVVVVVVWWSRIPNIVIRTTDQLGKDIHNLGFSHVFD